MKEYIKIGLVGILSNPPKKKDSHNAGWIKTILSQLSFSPFCREVKILTEKDDWNEVDQLYVTEGVNWKPGSWNVIGGINPSILLRLRKLNDYYGSIYCLGNEVPDYKDFCLKRNINFNFTKDIKSIPNICSIENWVLGDSHSISVYKPGYNINRVDFKTLHGFLKDELSSYLPKSVENLIFYAGNIDIRHHILRLANPNLAVESLVDELYTQLVRLNLSEVSIVEPLPIENESRIIPKTGYYKGTPYFGSWKQRTEARCYLSSLLHMMCIDHGWNFITWPEHFYNEKQELRFEVMEAKKSIHISPEHYLFLK